MTEQPAQPIGDPITHYWMVQRMARVCGADLAEAFASGQVSAEAWAEVIAKCQRCGWSDGCANWMARQTEARSDPPAACPNAEMFAAGKSR